MRIATWNVNSIAARLPRLVPWLRETEPDVVCLQEIKVARQAFPYAAVEAAGYSAAVHGSGRWNGVALLSRIGLAEVSYGFPGEPGAPRDQGAETGRESLHGQESLQVPAAAQVQARAVAGTCGGLRIWSLYVPNGRTLDDPQYAYKLSWLTALRAAVGEELAARPSMALVICGDFNVAPTDADVWDPAVFAGSTHVTPAERAALAGLQALGLHDVVPRPGKGDRPFTYWDYRAGMFHKDQGMRIDLVYATAPFAEAVRDAYVDRETRKGKGPSDHAPVIVDVALQHVDLP